jgi:CheY-like chemotaxis protein
MEKRGKNPADQGPKGADRRLNVRKGLILQAKYSDMDTYITGWTENISVGGFFLCTDRPFRLGQELTAQLSFPGLLPSIEINGRVAWIRKPSLETPAGVGIQVHSDSSRRRMARVAMLVDKNALSTAHKGPFRVLVVDDNELSRMACDRVLKHLADYSPEAIELDYAEHGQQALEMIAENLPDLLITDIYMPVMDGRLLLKRLRADKTLADLPAIVITAGGKDAHEGLSELGVGAILEKPLQFGRLFETIIYLIHLKSHSTD